MSSKKLGFMIVKCEIIKGVGSLYTYIFKRITKRAIAK